jgi:ParB family chromosome partitioning protein
VADLIPSITEVAVADVVARDRLRPVSEAGVAALIASINELGAMKDAIHVRKKKDGSLNLLAGGHRLEAARRLGWQVIPAKVWTCTDDWARLMEIDDNLAGAELSPLDTAIFLARRKAVYERIHPEAKAATGAALVAKRWDTTDTMSVVSFARATAEKFGLTERHVRRLVEAGHKLGIDEIGMLRRAPKPVTLKDLMVVAKCGDAAERHEVVKLMATGEAKSAAAARAALKAENAPAAPEKDPVEAAFKALRDAWSRAPMAARRRFVAAEWTALDVLCAEVASGEDDAE